MAKTQKRKAVLEFVVDDPIPVGPCDLCLNLMRLNTNRKTHPPVRLGRAVRFEFANGERLDGHVCPRHLANRPERFLAYERGGMLVLQETNRQDETAPRRS